MIEAPKARASRRQRRRVGWGMGRGARSPAEGLGERRDTIRDAILTCA